MAIVDLFVGKCTFVWHYMSNPTWGNRLNKYLYWSTKTFLSDGNYLRHTLPVLSFSHMWLFKFKIIKMKYNFQKFSSLITWATFQLLSSHMWLVATILNSVDYKTFPSLQKVLLDCSLLPAFAHNIPLTLVCRSKVSLILKPFPKESHLILSVKK